MATATEDGGRTRARTAIVLAALSGTAFFLAIGTTELVAAAILDQPLDRLDDVAAPEITAADTRVSRTAEGTAILARNIFDSALGAIDWELPPPPPSTPPEGGEVETPVDTTDPLDAHPACEGAIRLVGSWVRRDQPTQSFAAITNAAGTPLLYREAMNVDDRAVVLIEAHRVVMRPAAGTLCDISMFAGVGGAAVATARTAPAVVATAEPVIGVPGSDSGIPGIDGADLDANITANGDTSWTINRTLVDRLLANQAALMSAARVIPHEEDGRVVGVKIYGIRRSSLLGRLGVQNGDMLRTINGFDLTEPDSVLQAYTSLRSADHLSLSVMRRGAPLSLDYTIH